MSHMSAVCGHCLKAGPAFDCVLSTFRYQMPVDALIYAMKHAEGINLMRTLVPELAKKIAAFYPDERWPDCLVPVPMHWLRLWRRGFNQAFYLAKALQMALPRKLPIRDLVKRKGSALAQKHLTRLKRQKNVENNFIMRKPCLSEHVAIVDDVVTTGATCEALAQLLKEQGVQRVDVWSLARA